VDCPAGDGGTPDPGGTGGGADVVAAACSSDTATTGGAPDGAGGVPVGTGDAGSTVDGQQG
jgi:hypothetical protein